MLQTPFCSSPSGSTIGSIWIMGSADLRASVHLQLHNRGVGGGGCSIGPFHTRITITLQPCGWVMSGSVGMGCAGAWRFEKGGGGVQSYRHEGVLLQLYNMPTYGQCTLLQVMTDQLVAGSTRLQLRQADPPPPLRLCPAPTPAPPSFSRV
jgi:hypothetical protein